VQLEADMQGGRGQASYMRSGVMASRIPTPRHLRFCPVCIEEDKRRFKEAYWHRTHQVPGVEVCPTHGVFLDESTFSRGAGRNNLQFITVGEAARASPPRRIDFPDRSHQVLLQIARDVAGLLNNPGTGSDLSAIHNRYLKLLIGRGLATCTGSIHVTALLDEFITHYSPSLIQLLHCEFHNTDRSKTNWLLRLVRPPKYAQHPLYHLLLIQLLGCTAEEFFQLPADLSFFGAGPWPCLNPAAGHYRAPVIQACKLSSRLRDKRPIGTFSCGCGYAYARAGPDSSPEDKFRISRMISFGPVWEAKLKQLWKDSSLSLSEVGRQLGVDPLTVRRHAAKLKLSHSRFGRKSKPLSPKAQLKGQQTSAAWERKRRGCRSKWLSAIKQNRKITLKALRHKLPREYAWLLQNDSEWLKRHKPRPHKHNRSTSGVDWKRRDAQYAIAVRDAAARLKNAAGRPIQITRTAIGRAIGAITLLQQKLHKMPLTAQVLASVMETREQYAVRRVWWAADHYCQEGVLPREWQIVMSANVYSLREVPAVKCAVKDAMNMLRSKPLQKQAERADS
jgi:hypothetical protein